MSARQEQQCEVCGAPVTVQVCDLEELAPVPDENGVLYRNYRLLERHVFCAGHDRPTRIFRAGQEQA